MLPKQKVAYEGIDFGFPVAPYPIQQQFMEKLFETIEKKEIGIFESPTGTVGSVHFLEKFRILNFVIL